MQSSKDFFTLLYQDDDYVAINKPSGIHVHPTRLSSGERVTCMTALRDQLGAWVYPVHRLDRATSGVLVFALSAEAARGLASLWQERSVRKLYHAVVRGWVQEQGEIDRPLSEEKGKPKVPARSTYRRLDQVECLNPVGKYATARYSLVEVETFTGRYHQVRKHMASISHPLLGDTTYGDGDHNRYFREKFGLSRLCLSSHRIEFEHPITGAPIKIEAPLPMEFSAVFR